MATATSSFEMSSLCSHERAGWAKCVCVCVCVCVCACVNVCVCVCVCVIFTLCVESMPFRCAASAQLPALQRVCYIADI